MRIAFWFLCVVFVSGSSLAQSSGNECAADSSLLLIHMYDSWGDGWLGFGSPGGYQLYDSDGVLLFENLIDEADSISYCCSWGGVEYGVDSLCLSPGCYVYTFTGAENYSNEQSWMVSDAFGNELLSGSPSADLDVDAFFFSFGDILCEDSIGLCSDSIACNYYPESIDIEGGCDYESCAGCTDSLAINYDANALIEEGSCCYPPELIDEECGYFASFDVTLAGGEQSSQVFAAAGVVSGVSLTVDFEDLSPNASWPEEMILTVAAPDGTCFQLGMGYDMFLPCHIGYWPSWGASAGCNSTSIELEQPIYGNGEWSIALSNGWPLSDGASYEAEILLFGLCEGNDWPNGCLDDLACNYEISAPDDGATCYYANAGYDCEGDCLYDADNDGVCDEFEIAGCQVLEACNYNANATDEDGSCEYPEVSYDCNGVCLSDEDGDGVCDEFEVPGCQDIAACNYNPEATESSSCSYPEEFYNCEGTCLNDFDLDGICDENEILGCTDLNAFNYDPTATDDDSSCAFTTPVTFQVDMTQEPSVSLAGVHIAGDFQGWDLGASPMNDNDGDGVWEITMLLEVGDYLFVYINGDTWADPVENFYGDCTNNQGQRMLSVGSEPLTSLVCFNSCEASCPIPTPVTFQVDMTQASSVSSSGVHIAGDFQNWIPDSSPMNDEDGDGVWEITMLLDQGEHFFKFINGNDWADAENPSGDCTDGQGNRLITAGEEPLEYEACFGYCGECPPTDDDLPWVHDCRVDSCDTWVFGNGTGLTGTPWEGIDLNFECTTDGPSGPYNQWAGGTGDGSPAEALNSTTADNGLLLIDSDLYGADYGEGANWIENSWVQTAEPVSCAITDFVRLSFQTRYRCWDNGNSNGNEKCLVEISRDGVNWPDINTTSEDDGYVDYGNGDLIASRFEVFPEFNTGDQTDNPSVINLDISSAAGGQSNIWIRFRWVGTWGYSWEIDDIVLTAIPDNDLKIGGYVSTTDYLNTGTVEVGAIPQGQINAYQAGVEVVNTGLNEQNQISVALSADGQFLSESDTTTIGYDSEMLFQFNYSLTDLDTGFHELEFEIYNSGNPWGDETPDDNRATQTIEVTEYQLGRDNGVMTSSFPTNDPEYFSVINPFHINEGATVYGIDVAFAEGSATTQDALGYLQIGDNMEDVMSPWQNVQAEAWEFGIGEQMLNAPGDSVIKWTTMLFEEPVSVSQGDWVGAVIESWAFGLPIRVGMAQAVYPNTCFVEGPFGSNGTYDLYYTSKAPMIRLNFDPDALATGVGCLNEASCNYNPNAFEPFVFCDTTSCAGCLDTLACNYDPSSALSNPDMCTYPGCMDPEANNYNGSAGCEGECIYLYYDCGSIGDEDWAFEDIGVFPSFQQAMHGVNWDGQWVFNIPSEIVEPNTGYLYPIHHVNWTAVEGLPTWVESASYSLEEVGANSQHCIEATGVPNAPGWHDVIITTEVFISIFGQPFSIGEQFYTATLEVQTNPNPIPGCTYYNAPNFTPYATQDDGSCIFPGCTNPEAGNFNPLATIDDGSCGEACETSDDAFCEADNDGDGVITVSDLLILLGAFGSTCE